MTLYIDSAVRTDVEPLLATGLFAGIATNPTLLNRAGLSQDAHRNVYQWASAAGAQRVFFQARGSSAAEAFAMGRRLRALGDNVVVKLPATRVGLAAAARLRDESVPTLITAVYHSSQALLAVAAGAHYIAPYVGRMEDNGRDGMLEVEAIVKITTSSDCRVLAASLRSPDQVAKLAAVGVQDFAVSVPLCEQLFHDGLTDAASDEFEALGRP